MSSKKKRHDLIAETESTTVFNRRIVLTIISLLVVSNLFFVYLWINNSRIVRTYRSTNKFYLIDYARNFIDPENFFSTIEPIRKQMKELVAGYEAQGHKVGVYFEFLNTGSNIAINQDARFWPASLSKMPTAFAVMKKVENGDWSLDNELVLFAEDQDSRFGELYRQTPGTRFTIEQLLKETLINSDNTAHKILVRNLSSDDYTKAFEALGMEELYNEEYNITAKEYSRIFRALYAASYLSREHSQLLLDWLTQTKFNYFLGAGLPEETVFAHKIGEEYKESVYLDSGIFYVDQRPCLITVMVETRPGGNVEEAKEIMSKLSSVAYEYVSQ